METPVIATCCQQRENRAPAAAPRAVAGGTVIIEVCRVCGRRHHTLVVDPGVLGTRGIGLGG